MPFPKRATYCLLCGKIAFRYRADAFRFIRRGRRYYSTFDPTGLQVYLCPHAGGFHFGHDRVGRFSNPEEAFVL